MQHKHKKTRKEKIIADYRHQVYILKSTDMPSNNPTFATPVSGNSNFNTHVLKDVLKTGVLSLSIIAAQIMFFFLLKKHIIVLPMLKY